MPVDLNNFIHKETTTRHGNLVKQKLYHLTCNNCGVDRGFQAKSFNPPTCNKCSHKGITLSQETKDKMSWDNYGLNGWEIDHKIPDSRFTYSSTDDQGFKESWRLENLQPIWYWNNRPKGACYADCSIT